MKKFYLFAFAFLATFFAHAQNKKLCVGLVASPDVYNFHFKGVSGFNHTFKTKINYSVGLSMQYNFNNKIGVRTGLQYAAKGYILNYVWIVNDPNDPNIPLKSNLKASYLDLPIMIQYNFINRNKFALFSAIGFIAGFLISDKEVSEMSNGSEKETKFINQNLNASLLAAEINFGLDYHVSKNLYLKLSPFFRYGFNKMDEEVMLSNPVSYGGQIGIFYCIK